MLGSLSHARLTRQRADLGVIRIRLFHDPVVTSETGKAKLKQKQPNVSLAFWALTFFSALQHMLLVVYPA